MRDAEDAAKQAESFKGAPGVVVISRYPAAGLHEVNVSLDSDDITVKSADGTDVVIEWEAGCEGVEQPTVTLEEHTLSVRRANPDVFKTFFSVFQKEGGKVTVRVPRGYAADYVLSTTSGDIRLYAIDVDKVKVNTTSGRRARRTGRGHPRQGNRRDDHLLRRDGQRLRGRRGGQHRFGQTVRLLRREPRGSECRFRQDSR